MAPVEKEDGGDGDRIGDRGDTLALLGDAFELVLGSLRSVFGGKAEIDLPESSIT